MEGTMIYELIFGALVASQGEAALVQYEGMNLRQRVPLASKRKPMKYRVSVESMTGASS
jgi:hypothetical protein